ncbi:MAG: hypothetical protein IKK13_01060 [Clostridia bacterium]|nr:hypothetical protein [Clostridia bacterium]
MRRILILLLALAMLLSLTACGGSESGVGENGGSAAETDKGSVNLAFNAADTFNPYTAKTTLNKNLCSLIFDPLIKLDREFNSVNVLAASVEQSGEMIIVTLKSATFSDGSALTPDDVVYSFNLAKNSNEKYKSMLSTVLSCSVRDAGSVIFTLSRVDANGASLLNFPIIKIGSDNYKNEDNVYLPPIGCGRYVIGENGDTLLANKSWHGGGVSIGEIRLVNAPDNESLAHSVEIGAIDYYYTDLSDCNIIRMSGEKATVPLNNLVYLGVNMNMSALSSGNMRHAISAAINRNAVSEQGYYNNFIPANGLFLPSFRGVQGVQTIENTANIKIAIENLAKIGYNNKNGDGYLLAVGSRPLEFTLLVNKENQFRLDTANLIARQLAAVGIKLNINAVDFERYKLLLESRNFELYLAEVNIPYDMDISPLVLAGGSAAYGVAATGENEVNPLQQVISSYFAGNGGIQDIAVTAISEMPIIPIGYRTGVLFCSEKIELNNKASASDIFFGFEDLNLK